MDLFVRIFHAFSGLLIFACLVYFLVWTVKQFTRRK